MPIETASRGSYAKTAVRREQILRAAFEIFSVHGYGRGSVRDIADLAGVSHGVVLFHFKTKENLLVAVLEMRDEHSRKHFPADAEPGIEGLRQFLGLIRSNVQDPGLVELYSVLSAEATVATHPVHDYFRKRYAWITQVVRASLAAMGEKGYLQPGVDPDRAARALVAVVEGLQLQWLYDRAGVDMVDDVESFMQSLLTVRLMGPANDARLDRSLHRG